VALQRAPSSLENDSGIPAVSRTIVSFDTFFPCVHGANTGELVRLHAFVAPQARSILKVTSPAVDEQCARVVIGASRYSERDERSALGVIVSVSRTAFSGDSYELALAIADKLARYASGPPENPVIATGRVPHDGCGAVDAINHLHSKLQLVLGTAQKGSYFLFPQVNLDSASAEEKRLLEELSEAGIRWHAVSRIDECMDILSPSSRVSESASQSATAALQSDRHTLPGWRIAAWLIPIVALILVTFLLQSEKSPGVSTDSGAVTSNDLDQASKKSQILETQQIQTTQSEKTPRDSRPLESPYIDPAHY
jgi:hypothetical protein